MEQELNRYILNIPHRPNRTARLIALPMYRYRIQTNQFDYGLNFFQRTILMFKALPGITNNEIHSFTGLDERLVALIVKELELKGLINEYGLLTDKGKQVKDEVEGIIVTNNNKEIGYVFQYIDKPELYPYYIKKLNYVTGTQTQKSLKLVTGTKGDTGDEDYYSDAIIPDLIIPTQVINPVPSEKEILTAITRSSRKARADEEFSEEETSVKGNLSLSIIPNNHPDIVWVGTYVYLPKIEEDIYDNEWRVLDPFEFGNNIDLKFYVEEMVQKHILQNIDQLFKEWVTKGDQTVSAYNEYVDREVNKLMDVTFDLGYQRLDKNLIKYLYSIIRSFYLMEHNPSQDNSDTFCSNIQKALETILRIDMDSRVEDYEYLTKNYQSDNKADDEFYASERDNDINKLFNQRLIPRCKNRKSFCKLVRNTNPKQASSLKALLGMLFLSYYQEVKKDNILFEILKGKIDFIYNLADSRNKSQHGEISSKRETNILPMQEAKQYMTEFQHIINDFINKYNE